MNVITQFNCEGCGSPAYVSVVFAAGPDNDDRRRLYLPNQGVRAHPESAHIVEVKLCKACNRRIEDTINAMLPSRPY